MEAARRELLEETGYEADLWQCMGAFRVDGTRGICTAHLFRAEALRQVSTPQPSDMEELELVFMGPDEIRASVRNQEMVLLPDLAIIAMAASDLFRGLFRECET